MKKSIRKNYRYKMKMKRKEQKKWNRGLNLHKIIHSDDLKNSLMNSIDSSN